MINISKEAYQVPWEEGGIQVLFAIELSIEFESSVQKFQMEYTDKTIKLYVESILIQLCSLVSIFHL